MKTKYILHGGYASHINSENNLFFREIFKLAPKNPHVLIVNFAKDNLPSNVVLQFEKNKGNKNPSFDVSDASNFI